MARINIEDKWWSDPRRKLVCDALQNSDAADGQMYRLIKTAQHYWCDKDKPRGLIPKSLFISSFSKSFIESGLVIEQEAGFYLCGSKEHFDWYVSKIESASKGGKASAKSRQSKYGSSIPLKAVNSRSTAEAESKQPRSDYEATPNALTLTPPLTLAPTLTTKLNTNTKKGQKDKEPPPDGVGPVISAYCDSFTKRYNSKPVLEGKDIRAIKDIIKAVGKDRALVMVQVYLQMDNKWFKEKTHDLLTLRGNLPKVLVAMNTGEDPDRKEDMFGFFNKSKEVAL